MRMHGKASTYRRGCRCAPCTAANTAKQRRWKAKVAQRAPQEIPHGRHGYVNYGCRCEVCTAANTEQSNAGRLRRGPEYAHAAGAKARKRAKERAAADPSLVPHGTYRGYTYWGCRCVECRGASAAYWRDYRARRAAGDAS